jgi:hypothetical protein
MIKTNIILGIVMIGIGILFSLNNKNMGEGCAEFYKKLYTKKSMPFMFKAAGVILIVGGLIVLLK